MAAQSYSSWLAGPSKRGLGKGKLLMSQRPGSREREGSSQKGDVCTFLVHSAGNPLLLMRFHLLKAHLALNSSVDGFTDEYRDPIIQ